MPTQPEERRRLAALMDERRLELSLRWQEVATIGGISLRALNNARSGDREIRPLTRRGIEKGLQWAPGFIERFLAAAPAPDGDEGREDPGTARWDDDPRDDDAGTRYPADETKRKVWRAIGHLPESEREEIMRLIDRERGGGAQPPRRQADVGLAF